MSARHPFLILALAALASGCTSPSAFSGVAPKVIAAPFLTYVDGDEKAGTTTFVSLPLLTYRSSRTAPGRLDTNTCVTPFLFNMQETTKEIRVVREAAKPGCPDPEVDPLAPPLDTKKAPSKKKRKKKKGTAKDAKVAKKKKSGGVTLSRPRDDYELPIRRSKRRRRAPTSPKKAKEMKAKKKTLEYESLAEATTAERRWEGVTLPLPVGAEVGKHRYPARSGAMNLLFPLIRIAREIPGRAIVSGRGGKRVYEVGPSSTEIRFLPLFSHKRTRKIRQTILWPLLGFGWETTAKGTYIRLFYFLRFKVD